MNQVVNFAGADPGNSALKGIFLTAKGSYSATVPNVIGDGIPLDIPPLSLHPEDALAVKVHSAQEPEHQGYKFCGSLAMKQLIDQANQDFMDRNKADGPAINVMLPALLGLVDHFNPWVLCVGATLTDFSFQSPLIEKALTRRHTIEYFYGPLAGQKVNVNVLITERYPQCAAGLFSMMHQYEGSVRGDRKDWLKKTLLGLDIGHGQTNIAVMRELEFVKAGCFSVDYGFYHVGVAVQEYLNRNHYVTVTIPQLQPAIESGYYTKNGKKIDLREVIDAACNNLLNLILAAAKPKIPKSLYDSISEVVTLGAAAQTMAPYVGSALQISTTIADHPRDENARGLSILAQQRWSRLSDAQKAEMLKHA